MKKLPLVLAVASALSFATVFADGIDRDRNNKFTYHVTITNTTANQILTPPTVIAHNRKFKLFELAQPASDELIIMAEGGNNGPLISSLGDNNVYATASSLDQTPPVIMPGNSITIEIKAPRRTFFTVTTMLATTNDAFASVTLRGPKKYRTNNARAETYDAGSEVNNEYCDDIPGPPCGGANIPVDGDGEGFITIHNGIHGIGDLIPSDLDWRGPTAAVSIHNAGK
ncbi:MAG: hypothetical protein COA74_07910 [Gammaproteobacteria bacterium]|nr:MAG: hypothetical protein COA74_07910 [Gammaproteobacteria bacterium]